MPFGLKNVGTMYQRLMNKMFIHQIGRNVQVYMSDMLVKSIREDDYLDNLKETFNTLCSFNMKLLGTYFYVIGISFDKTHFTCI